MKYTWYEFIKKEIDVPLTQGDILDNVPVSELIVQEEPPYYSIKSSLIPKGIILTQACDFQKKNVKHLTVAPLIPLGIFLKDTIDKELPISKRLKGEELAEKKTKRQERKIALIEQLRKGNILDYYLLNKSDFEEDSDNFGYMIVLLRNATKVPKDVMNKIVENNPSKRVQLQLPYREHLARSYSRLYDRIGLPIDLDIDESEFDV